MINMSVQLDHACIVAPERGDNKAAAAVPCIYT